jgi:lysophospholipase L1-like esterase
MAALAIGEGFLRLAGYDALTGLKNGRQLILKPSSNLDAKYELIPGAKGHAWDTYVEINAHGYRGQTAGPEKRNRFRAIAIGDSITFGNGLPLESTYSYQLTELLNQSFPASEVLNFGVGGYDIVQSVALFEDRGLIYKPDLLIVGYCLNDAGIASPNLEYIVRSNEYQSNPIFRFLLAQFVSDKIDRIRIGNWMKEKNQPEVFQKEYESRIAAIGENERVLRELMQASPSGYPSVWYGDEHRIGRLRYAFERLSALARSHDFRVVVVIFPWLVGDASNYPYEIPHAIIRLEAQRVGLDVLEVLHDFQRIGMTNLRISKNDLTHPNSIGHKVIAEKLAEYIRNEWARYNNPPSTSNQQGADLDRFSARLPISR